MRLNTEARPQPAISTSTELAIIAPLPAIVPVDFFKPNGSVSILEGIKAEVRKAASALDISTETGRKSIASLAYREAKAAILEVIVREGGEGLVCGDLAQEIIAAIAKGAVPHVSIQY